MQTSYIKAVEAAAEAIKAVEDVNARAEVVKDEILEASKLLSEAMKAEKDGADEMIALLQRLDQERRARLGKLVNRFGQIAKIIEGNETPDATPASSDESSAVVQMQKAAAE